MAHEFSGSAVIDRPIVEVFAFLADGTNDPKFSPRVQAINKTTDGPVAVGTVFESTVKDAGMTTSRKFELTEFEAPMKIRWTERSKNMITVPVGGYDLERMGDTQTKLTIHNAFEGHGFGKLIDGFALKAAIKDAPAFAQRIKEAVEASSAPATAVEVSKCSKQPHARFARQSREACRVWAFAMPPNGARASWASSVGCAMARTPPCSCTPRARPERLRIS